MHDEAHARCPYFGQCGGCQTQDVDYPEQLREKGVQLRALFKDFWDGSILVRPSPTPWNYRNRVDFNFARKHYDEPPPKDFVRETVLGFTRKGMWYWPIDIEECHIAPERTSALLKSVRQWYRDKGLDAFDSRAKGGFLRVLLVRESVRTGEGLVALITSAGEFDDESFVRAVLDAYPAKSIYRGITHRSARGAFADEAELLYGEPVIEERLQIPTGTGLRELRFHVSPFSFFQTNSLGAEVLYGVIRQWVERIAPDILYDLYGGSGGIALTCADVVKLARSVESVPEATEDGQANAAMNGVDNIFFTTEKIERYLLPLANEGGMEPNSAVVLDPPRAGLNPKALKRLLLCQPPHILYISCKPSVLAEEMAAFSEAYVLTELSAVDLFPHTPHIEVIAALKRRF